MWAEVLELCQANCLDLIQIKYHRHSSEKDDCFMKIVVTQIFFKQRRLKNLANIKKT